MNDLARRRFDLDEWLDSGNCPADPVVTELLALNSAEFQSFVQTYGPSQRFEIARQLVDRAHWLLSRRPKDAVDVALLADHFARSTAGLTAQDMDTGLELEADTRREYAHALLTVGDFDNARIAADEATFLYGALIQAFQEDNDALYWYADSHAHGRRDQPDLQGLILRRVMSTGLLENERRLLEKATAFGLIRGQIHHGQGDTERGLLLIQQSSSALLSLFHQNKKYVDGRLIYAAVLLRMHRYTDALDAFQDTAAVARELNDSETLAHILNNVGVCYRYLGHPDKAKQCAETALKMFEDLGLSAEALRPRNALATLLIEEGTSRSYRHAASALYMNRNTYLSIGLPNDAAQAMLRITKALILAGRSSEIDWPANVELFAGQTGIRKQALDTLRFLRDTAALRTLLLDDVHHAERLLEGLDNGTYSSEEEVG